MSGAKRSNNRSRLDCFLATYYRTVMIVFLITFGGALAIVLIQLRTRGAIKISFAQTGGVIESSANVLPNPINLLNEKLRQKETDLQLQESYLAKTYAVNEAKWLAYLFIISGTLFLLILLNFFFDHQRRKSHVE